jgi:hypothetical protein
MQGGVTLQRDCSRCISPWQLVLSLPMVRQSGRVVEVVLSVTNSGWAPRVLAPSIEVLVWAVRNSF